MEQFVTPYFDRFGVTLFQGDAREILPTLAPVDAIVTDPPWPGVPAHISGSTDPYGLFTSIAMHFPRLTQRVVIQVGEQSDPRMLAAIPAELPFMRLCTLDFLPRRYRGMYLLNGDVAYIFGSSYLSVPGTRCLPGRAPAAASRGKRDGGNDHPCPRRVEHVQWLIHWYTRPGCTVLDCFNGSGTTALACRLLGRRYIGIELEKRWLDLTIERLERRPMLDFAPDAGTEAAAG